MLSPIAKTRTMAALALAALLPAAAHGDVIQAPVGDVILTISGDLDRSNGDGMARFDMAMLTALESRTIATTTIWTEGEQQFRGVGLETLLDLVGVNGGTLQATAINDYSVAIPAADASPTGPIIAYSRNDEPMSLRNKGPLWVIYPYDSDPAYRTETIYGRSIWQLDRIEVLPD